MADSASPEPASIPAASPGIWSRLGNQLGIRQLVSDYLIPVETNHFLYLLGGVLAISLALEVLSGFLLALVYVPDAALAYGVTQHLLSTPGWSLVLNFHFYNSYLIFGLILVHMLRVFVTGGYRRGKEGLWMVGVALAGLTFVISLTGEALHWDEVGFGVPWNIGEVLSAVGLADAFNYTSEALLSVPTATEKLVQIYALHISIVPIGLLLFIGWHYLLIRFKGISVPFWLRESGRTASFSSHIKGWLILATVIIGAVVLISVFVPRDPGTAPQLISSSPLFGTDDDPGGLGFKPTYPISWTRGMNIIAAYLGVDPDIWGTVLAMALMLGVLLLIPFLDRSPHEPDSWASAFNLRARGLAFGAMGIFLIVLLAGLVVNFFSEAG